MSTSRKTHKSNKLLSSSSLKLIAMATMLIDHIGAGFLIYFMRYGDNYIKCYRLYSVLRNIGRVSFPIFIFLLVEGFYHTKDIRKYLLRLLLFCFVSEIPFDLAFFHQVFDWQHQNVFFTMLIGLAAIAVMNAKKHLWKEKRNRQPIIILDCLLNIAVTAAAMYLAYLLKTDYHYAGVLAIIAAYWLHSYKDLRMWGVCIILLALSGVSEVYAVFCIPFISYYNGRRGSLPKWIPYFFYPVHLLVIWAVTTLICGRY